MITLATVETEFGPIHVFRKRSTGAISYEQDGCCQSEADIDAYQGARIPAHLQSLAFYSLVRDRLSLSGAIFVNVHLAHAFDRQVDKIAECMSTIFANVRLLDSTQLLDRNAIVMGGHVARTECPRMLVPPLVQQEAIAAELAALKFRSWR